MNPCVHECESEEHEHGLGAGVNSTQRPKDLYVDSFLL